MSPEFKAWEEIGNRTEAMAKDYWRLLSASAAHRNELAQIEAVIESEGVWKHADEWRVMTWSNVSIKKTRKNDKDWFFVSVECDGQKFECECPDLQRAFYFSCWYRHLITYQFYAIGATWAEVPRR